MPLVSICIPAYRSEKYIGETIDCLLKQTYQNLEIIVVIDGSEDGTEDFLKTIPDQRLKYYLQPNKGAAAARNESYKHSKGVFIKFMDADDLINPECIELQMQKISDRTDCIASAKWGRFYRPDGLDFKFAPEKIYKDLPGMDWLIESLIYSGANMMQPGIFLIPRSLIDKVGLWNESLSLIDDFEYMVRVISASKKVFFCEEAVLMYRSGLSGNLSGKKTTSHMNSAFQSLNLGIERILKFQNDGRSRLACANIYQKWAYQFYPDHPELCNKTEAQIKILGGSDINIGGGRLYILLSKLIGWKKASKLKKYSFPTLRHNLISFKRRHYFI
jgi:glycosyltransferase involved in cell wall biosynthesis